MRTSTALREHSDIAPVPIVTSTTHRISPPRQPDADWRNPSDMPASVHIAALACWIAFLGLFWITFAFSANAEFMVVISTVYAVVFFSVPAIMARMAPKRSRKNPNLLTFLSGQFDTLYGRISGWDAFVQVTIVPAALTLGGIGIAMAIHAARAGH